MRRRKGERAIFPPDLIMFQEYEDRTQLWRDVQIMLHEIWKCKELAYPDAQDSASFMVQEATEVVDIFLRRKNYNRNNKKPFDKFALAEEIAQVLMMTFMTAYLQGINPFDAFQELFVKYTEKDSS